MIKRAAIVSRIFAPEAAAAAFRLRALADALSASGAATTVFTSKAPPGVRDEDSAIQQSGVHVRRAPVLRDSSGSVRGYVQYMSFDLPLVFRLLTGPRQDVYVVEPPPTTGAVVRLCAWLRRTPYVYYAADIWSDAAKSTGSPGFVVAMLRALESWSLRGAKHVVAVTDGVAERVRELGGHDRVTVVTNGVDTSVFTDSGAAAPLAPLAVYTGTTSEWQGAEIFIDAMPAVRDAIPGARIVFLGQGSAWEALKARALRTAPDAIEFRPLAPPLAAAQLLRSARVALVSLRPGLGYDFAIPTKIFAATACGTPVLFAGDGAGAAVVRDNQLGQCVRWEADEVAAALIRALEQTVDPQTRVRLGSWSRQTVSIESTAKKVAELVAAAAR